MIAASEQEYDAALVAVRDAQLADYDAREEARAAAKEADKRQAKAVLVEQMEERKQQQLLAKLEFERERFLVDEIQRRILEEEEAEWHQRAEKQRQTREYIRNFLLEQEEKRALAMQEEEEEERAIEAFAAKKRAHEEAEEAKKNARKAAADHIYAQVRGRNGEGEKGGERGEGEGERGERRRERERGRGRGRERETDGGREMMGRGGRGRERRETLRFFPFLSFPFLSFPLSFVLTTHVCYTDMDDDGTTTCVYHLCVFLCYSTI